MCFTLTRNGDKFQGLENQEQLQEFIGELDIYVATAIEVE